MDSLKLSIEGGSASSSPVVNIRCPECLNKGSFHGLSDVRDFKWHQPIVEAEKRAGTVSPVQIGVRKCPNPDCGAPVFVVIKEGNKALRTYPPEVIDFDATDIPSTIKATLEEAIQCHAHSCFKASALMVRRLLEEVCQEREATGDNLKKRIHALKSKIVIPAELLTAADELRILGNNAAHIEARTYDEIGKEEVTVAIELAKEILKSVYQYKSLLDKLKNLQTKPEQT
jgi:uncharacterized protein DUF4145